MKDDDQTYKVIYTDKLLYKEEQPQLEISTMTNCPIKCRLCPQDIFLKKYKGTHILRFEDFKSVVDKIPLNVGITFSGMGEPFLNKDCVKMILYAYDTGHTHIRVFTTGVGLTTTDIDDIIHIPFEIFQLHIQDLYGITKIVPTQQVLDTLMKLSASRKFISNFKAVTFGEKYNRNLKKLFPHIKSMNVYNRAGALGEPDKDMTSGKITCGLYTKINHFVMQPNGDVGLCCMDWGLKHMLGNLFTDSYESLFESDEYKKIRKGFADDNIDIACRRCSWTLKAHYEILPPQVRLKQEQKFREMRK